MNREVSACQVLGMSIHCDEKRHAPGKIVKIAVIKLKTNLCQVVGGVAQWLERQSSAGELSLSCARLAAYG